MRKITLTQFMMLAMSFTGISTMAQTHYFVDFNQNTTATYVTPGNWNNYHDAAVGTLTDIISDAGVASTIDMAVTDAFVAANGTGTTTPASTLPFPATATSDSFYVQDGANNTGAITISSLDPTKVYTFLIFASRAGVTDTRVAKYTATGSNVGIATLDGSNNTANTCTIAEIAPDASGNIVLKLEKDASSTGTFAYLGCMKMTETTPAVPQVLLNAENGGAIDGEFYVVDALKIHVMANGPGESVNDYALVANPLSSGINTSANVMKYTRRTTGDNAQPWSGFWSLIADGYGLPDVTVNKYVHVKVLKTNTSPLKFKLEGGAAGTIERGCNDADLPGSCQTTTGVWEDIVFNFTDRSGTCNVVGFMPDFEDPLTPGDDRIIYFDDIIINSSPVPFTMGIEENYLATRISLYPNPVQGMLRIDTLEDLQAVNLMTIDGRKVATYTDFAAGNHTIDMNNLNSGLYFVNMVAKNGASLTKKVVKE